MKLSIFAISVIAATTASFVGCAQQPCIQQPVVTPPSNSINWNIGEMSCRLKLKMGFNKDKILEILLDGCNKSHDAFNPSCIGVASIISFSIENEIDQNMLQCLPIASQYMSKTELKELVELIDRMSIKLKTASAWINN